MPSVQRRTVNISNRGAGGLCAFRRELHFARGTEIHGSIANNLSSAVKSARRLKGQPIHTDTLGHWTELLDHARLELSRGSTEQLAILIVELESELADRADS